MLAAATLSGAVAFYAWRHRGTPGAGAISLMMLAASVWSFFYALELAAVGLEAKVFFAKPQYLGICAIPLSVLAFGTRYTGRNLKVREWTLLGVLPLATLALVFTNEAHGLIWASTRLDGSGAFLVLEHGPLFWVYWVYSYVLILAGLATILSVFVHSGRLYRLQSGILLLGLLMPWLSNSLYVLDILPINGDLDLTPAAFTLTGVALAWGLFRFRLLDVVPVARHNIVEGMRDGVIVLDDRDRIVDLNPAASPILESADAVGMDASKAVRGWSDLESEGRIEMTLPPLDYELTLAKLEGEGTTGRVIILRDITDRKTTERELVESEDRYRRLVELSPDAIVVHSRGHIEYINAAGARAVGAGSPREVVGKRVMDFVHPDYKEMVENRMRGIYNGERAKFTEEKFVRMDGSVIDVETAATPISNNGNPAAQLVFREITERKALEEELARQAFHDALTKLPNRTFFMDLLSEKLSSEVEAESAGEVAILFLDLDGFKLINDSLGHECGDRLLAAAAGRVRSCVRPGDTVARIGGDEFTVLLGGSSGVGEAVLVAERISDSLKTPFSVEGHEVFVTTSIGIAAGRPSEYKASEMLRDADTAMYEAKRENGGRHGVRHGGTRHRVFEASMSESALRHLELEGDLNRALERDEFTVFFQPVVSTKTGDVSGLEALLRWNHPRRGVLGPGEFMGVAEEAGLMPEIGGKAFEETLLLAGEWTKGFPTAASHIKFGVNLSVRQLKDAKLAEAILRLLEENGVSPENLEIEVSEDAVIEDGGPAIATLARLEEAGVGLAMDDFGAGHSSLSQLKRIPFDTIKIDRSLTRGLENGSAGGEDATIFSGLVKLSHALGKKTVAEGVETSAQLEKLREMDCDLAQGNFLSPPLTPEETARLLEEISLHSKYARS